MGICLKFCLLGIDEQEIKQVSVIKVRESKLEGSKTVKILKKQNLYKQWIV